MEEVAIELQWFSYIPFLCSVQLHILPLLGTIVCPFFVKVQVAEGHVNHIISAPPQSGDLCKKDGISKTTPPASFSG